MPAWRMKWRARGLERTSLKTRHYAEKTTPEWIPRAYGTNELDIECIVVTTQEPHRTPALPGESQDGRVRRTVARWRRAGRARNYRALGATVVGEKSMWLGWRFWRLQSSMYRTR